MKVTLIVFSCLFVIRNDIFIGATLVVPRKMTPEDHRFMATIWNNFVGPCSAVIITRQHLITPASCVDPETTITVYLGFEQLPNYLSPPYGKNTQIYTTSRIFKHEHFDTATEEGHYVNNIAVVELEQPITFSDTIGPAKLISEKEELLIKSQVEDMAVVADVIGWRYANYSFKYSVMEIEYVDVRRTCDSTDVNQSDQQWCTSFTDDEKLPLYGNALMTTRMTHNSKVAGLMVHTHSCLSSPECKTHTFLNVIPFLKWISEKVNVSVAELTENNEKLGGAHENMEEMTQKHEKQKIDEILSKFESYKEAQTIKIDEINKKFESIEIELEEEREKRTKFEVQTNDLIQQLAIQNDAINGCQAKITKIETECISNTKENLKQMFNNMRLYMRNIELCWSRSTY